MERPGKELPFAGDIEASGGEAPTSEVATFKRVGTTVGHDRVPSLGVTIPSYIPQHSSWRNLVAEGKAGNPVNVRITTKERLLATSGAGNTAAISAAGAVTLSPTVVATPAIDRLALGPLRRRIGHQVHPGGLHVDHDQCDGCSHG